MRRIAVGSPAHKELFCREFIDSHDPYDPAKIDWPVLDDVSRERLRALPFWGEAVSTEHNVARKVQALAPMQTDPLLREAIALQGFEEGRHAALVRMMTRHYGIEVPDLDPDRFDDVEWAFIRTGYGECFDSFFAFGLLPIARNSGLFPVALVELFEPIVQEEARHILFFVNWIAYRRRQHALPRRARDVCDSVLAMALQVWARLQTARGAQSDDFMMNSTDSINIDVSPRAFLELCLREHDRRLAGYDARLLRPRFVPTVATMACALLKQGERLGWVTGTPSPAATARGQ